MAGSTLTAVHDDLAKATDNPWQNTDRYVLVDLVWVVASRGRYEQAFATADLARAFVARAGDDPVQRAELLIKRGQPLAAG